VADALCKLPSTKTAPTMTATLLNSKQAVEMDVFVVHAFACSRQMLAASRVFAAGIMELRPR
jgi:hypothetical protein